MGVRAININDDDRVVSVQLTNGTDEIVIANRNGRAIRFNEDQVRTMGRVATGVQSMTLDGGDDEVVGMVAVNDPQNDTIVVVSEKGYGKRSALTDEEGNDIYRKTSRRAKGVKTIDITEKTGKLVTIRVVNDEEDLMIINKSGVTIRMHAAAIRQTGRVAQGVKLIDIAKRNDVISHLSVVPRADEEAEAQTEETTEETETTEQQ